MRLSYLILCCIISAPIATQVEAQECPVVFSGWEGEEEARIICSAIRSFNQNGVPGVMADDCEGNDCCDDDDPTWFPSPPYSAIVSMGQWGVTISRLDEEHENRIRGALDYSNIFEDSHRGYSERRRIPSLDDSYSYNIPDEMRYLAQREQWIERAISNGNLVYYYLRSDRDRY